MPPWLFGAFLTTLQAACLPVGAWLVLHDIPVPEQVPYLLAAVAAGVVTAVVQWAERRSGGSWLSRLVLVLAKVAMLFTPPARYPRALPASAPLAERGGNGGRLTWRDG